MTENQKIAKVLTDMLDADPFWKRVAEKAGCIYWRQFCFRDFRKCIGTCPVENAKLAKKWWKQQKCFLEPFLKELLAKFEE